MKKKLTKMKELIKNQQVYCPICDSHFKQSEYLNSVFVENKRSLWLANMVTHYRHHHITSWNKCWGHNGNRYRSNWFGDYDYEKRKVNERAKRQIIRKSTAFMLHHKIAFADFQELQYNEKATIDLIEKKLNL